MKKNRKMLGLAAAALLAVAPVVASTVPVNADVTANVGSAAGTAANTNTTQQAPVNKPYFTYNNEIIGEASQSNPLGNVVRSTISFKAKDKVSTLIDTISKAVQFHKDNYAGGEKVTINKDNFISQLRANNVTVTTINVGKDGKPTKNNKPVKGGSSYEEITKVPGTSFNITLSASVNNQTATIQIPMVPEGASTPVDTTENPQINWTKDGAAQSASLNGQVFQVAVGSQFNPLNFTNSNGENIAISAQQSKNNTTYASIEATSNPVNTSEAGRYYNVTLTATGMTGKKTTATYMVLITSSQKQTLYANGASSITTYSIYGPNVLSNATTFKDGDQVYVSDQTKTINNVSYSQVSPKSKNDANSSNIWVKTSSLVKPAATEKGETHVVMVASRAYDKNGKYLGHMYDTYTNIDIVPQVVTINGKTYYKVAGKDEYVRVTNITGTQRKLRHNAYIYWSSYRRTPGTGKVYRGQTVTTYGASYRFRNGKRYYRISGCRDNNKRYIKAVNFY
ncbi:SLAP domain-containing protein [Lactobacillus ultunensis]|uniref:Putative bacterial surface layer protein n=1 Tax=Lactobacillus ultunensis DSM 16047 TaxID=525365 RepID=C2ELK0_9LACO|nr:SLAP domain-containing protein [Lactobacillus ultunensis]EEJ72557.1 putative bacterial surface layer protein [Lactobacillus ultunensis DSM 16047]KRL81178.1 surface layer protein HAP50 [Lactobacillus ultunensis DSM 16047]QQP28161.1 SLAP domain-containing protein [Lactobacillus ultunensis]